MKFVWEEADVYSGVVAVGASGEHWMIGSLSGASGACRYVLVSLRDGLTQLPRTPSSMILALNEGRYAPVLDWHQAETWVSRGRQDRDRPMRDLQS